MAFSFDLILAFSVDPVAAFSVEPEQRKGAVAMKQITTAPFSTEKALQYSRSGVMGDISHTENTLVLSVHLWNRNTLFYLIPSFD